MIRSSLLALVLAQNPGAIEGDAENGKVLFKEYTCYGCHGYTGETGFTSPPPPRQRPV